MGVILLLLSLLFVGRKERDSKEEEEPEETTELRWNCINDREEEESLNDETPEDDESTDDDERRQTQKEQWDQLKYYMKYDACKLERLLYDLFWWAQNSDLFVHCNCGKRKQEKHKASCAVKKLATHAVLTGGNLTLYGRYEKFCRRLRAIAEEKEEMIKKGEEILVHPLIKRLDTVSELIYLNEPQAPHFLDLDIKVKASDRPDSATSKELGTKIIDLILKAADVIYEPCREPEYVNQYILSACIKPCRNDFGQPKDGLWKIGLHIVFPFWVLDKGDSLLIRTIVLDMIKRENGGQQDLLFGHELATTLEDMYDKQVWTSGLKINCTAKCKKIPRKRDDVKQYWAQEYSHFGIVDFTPTQWFEEEYYTVLHHTLGNSYDPHLTSINVFLRAEIINPYFYSRQLKPKYKNLLHVRQGQLNAQERDMTDEEMKRDEELEKIVQEKVESFFSHSGFEISLRKIKMFKQYFYRKWLFTSEEQMQCPICTREHESPRISVTLSNSGNINAFCRKAKQLQTIATLQPDEFIRLSSSMEYGWKNSEKEVKAMFACDLDIPIDIHRDGWMRDIASYDSEQQPQVDFLKGRVGCGKSFVIRNFVRNAKLTGGRGIVIDGKISMKQFPRILAISINKTMTEKFAGKRSVIRGC